MATINPYLTFNGNCLEAFEFYRSVFGGEFPFAGRFSEMPPNPNNLVPEAEKDRIMHISLPISAETTLMGSDTFSSHGDKMVVGTNMTISVNSDSREETDRIFNGLAEGGKITMPLSDTFWNAYFGMLTDRFGIQWMLNCTVKGE